MLAVPMKPTIPGPVPRMDPATGTESTRAEPAPRAAPVTPAQEKRIRQAFDAHLNCVWRALRRYGVPEAVVDDAVQRVFIVLARRITDVEMGSERPFLLSTAARVASELRRTPHRNREHGDEAALLELQVDPGPLPDEAAERQRARVLLDLVLERMPDDLRHVFVLYEFESMTIPEIAELVGVPIGTAASRLRRARVQFKERVAKLESSRAARRGDP
jgi:RNA polymerase sigma-70 factor, ECF subfamily